MKKLNVKTIVFAAVLVAMNLVLSRVLAINIGSTLRITVSATPIYLASLWFGPLVGGICGGLGDLLGCLIQGYAPNPLILVSSVLAGVIPAVFKKYVFKDKVNTWKNSSYADCSWNRRLSGIYCRRIACILCDPMECAVCHKSYTDDCTDNCKYNSGFCFISECTDYLCESGICSAENQRSIKDNRKIRKQLS